MNKIKEVIEHFYSGHILAIGDLMIDQYLHGTVTRISPEAPVPVIDIENESYELGGAANAVNNIKSLGGTVEAVGVIGTDDAGRILLSLLEERGIDTKGIILSEDRPTTVKTRVIGNGNQIVRIDKETRKTIDVETTKEIMEFVEARIKEIDAILISDYDKGLITQYLLNKLIPLARSHDVPVIVNSKTENLRSYKNVTVIISDLFDASQVVGIKPIHETSVRNIGQWLLTHLDCKGVLIIRGKKGISIFEKDNDVKNFSISAKDTSDMTGVGGAITGAMALALANGSDMQTAATIANAAATVALGTTGTHTVTVDELLERIS